MTPTPPPLPVHLATDALRHADDWGVLLFILAILLVGAGGYRWVREKEREQEDAPQERGE